MSRPQFRWIALTVACGFAPASATTAGDVVSASTFTVQPGGPRTGRAGALFFNVEGRKNGDSGKYASFGVIEFRTTDLTEGDLKDGALTLTLTQDLAGFSADGPIKFYLARAEIDPRAQKFDLATIDGLGGQVAAKDLIGTGAFKKKESGKADAFPLKLDGIALEYLKGRVTKNEPIRIVVVPDDETVAATFLGAGSSEVSKRPRLSAGPPR
jgi:hypothetical protein